MEGLWSALWTSLATWLAGIVADGIDCSWNSPIDCSWNSPEMLCVEGGWSGMLLQVLMLPLGQCLLTRNAMSLIGYEGTGWPLPWSFVDALFLAAKASSSTATGIHVRQSSNEHATWPVHRPQRLRDPATSAYIGSAHCEGYKQLIATFHCD